MSSVNHTATAAPNGTGKAPANDLVAIIVERMLSDPAVTKCVGSDGIKELRTVLTGSGNLNASQLLSAAAKGGVSR